jgi:hypothetical protein
VVTIHTTFFNILTLWIVCFTWFSQQTALTGWSLLRRRNVFLVTYELNLYSKFWRNSAFIGLIHIQFCDPKWSHIHLVFSQIYSCCSTTPVSHILHSNTSQIENGVSCAMTSCSRRLMTQGAVFADSAADSARSSIASDGIRLMTHGAVVLTRRPQSRQSWQKPLRVSSALSLVPIFWWNLLLLSSG